jgi:hypothetical protein
MVQIQVPAGRWRVQCWPTPCWPTPSRPVPFAAGRLLDRGARTLLSREPMTTVLSQRHPSDANQGRTSRQR